MHKRKALFLFNQNTYCIISCYSKERNHNFLHTKLQKQSTIRISIQNILYSVSMQYRVRAPCFLAHQKTTFLDQSKRERYSKVKDTSYTFSVHFQLHQWHGSRAAGQLVHHFGRDRNIPTTIGWIAIQLWEDVHVPYRMNYINLIPISLGCSVLNTRLTSECQHVVLWVSTKLKGNWGIDCQSVCIVPYHC